MTRGLKTRHAPGTKVRLTGYFLKCTGQQCGSEGLSRWLVVACDCDLCKTDRFCAVNEPLDTSTGYDDLAPEDRPKWRHFALGNLEIVGAKPKAADYP